MMAFWSNRNCLCSSFVGACGIFEGSLYSGFLLQPLVSHGYVRQFPLPFFPCPIPRPWWSPFRFPILFPFLIFSPLFSFCAFAHIVFCVIAQKYLNIVVLHIMLYDAGKKEKREVR